MNSRFANLRRAMPAGTCTMTSDPQPSDVDETSLLVRRNAALDRLRVSRESVLEAQAGLGGLAAFRGTQWSVADILFHLKPGGHVEELCAALDDEGPLLAKLLKNKDAQLADLTEGVLTSIDEAIELGERLTTNDLIKTQQRGNKHKPVLEMLEGIAHHFEVHIEQIRETRARIGR